MGVVAGRGEPGLDLLSLAYRLLVRGLGIIGAAGVAGGGEEGGVEEGGVEVGGVEEDSDEEGAIEVLRDGG